MLIHAAQSTPDLVAGLPIYRSRLDVPLLSRIAQLWTSDLRRLTAARTECAAITAKYSALANESKATSEAMEAQISELSDHLKEEAANYAVLLRTSAANSDLCKNG
ncbi:hypothetical protein OKW19_008923 [Bradyrhizobium elkanii]|nr:hypothetical protein [Bradyrhizobium elkanii]